MSSAHAVRVAAWDRIDPTTAYALLRLRVDVFVVEQRCPYPELDGRDTEPATRHLWLDDGAGPTASGPNPPADASSPPPAPAPPGGCAASGR